MFRARMYAWCAPRGADVSGMAIARDVVGATRVPVMRVLGISQPLPHARPSRPARRRGRSWRVLDGLVALALVVLVAVAALNPNHPWMKRHVQAFVLSRSGLDVDYRWIHVHPFSGIEVDDFVVRAAPEFRAVTPDLLRASLLDVRWSPSSLLGEGPRLERITLSDVDMAVVVDENDNTSIDRFLSPKVALSHGAGQLLASTPVADRIEVTRADVEIVRTRENRVVERDRVRGLGAAVAAEPTGEGWRMRVVAGSTGAPLDVQWAQERDDGSPRREARASLSLAGVLTASTAEASLDLNLREQSLAPGLEAGDWHAAAIARFDPDAGRTTVTLERVASPAGGLTLEASIELPDAGVPIVRHARGDVDVARLLACIPAGLLPVTAEGGVLRFEVASATLERPPRLSADGLLHVEADLTNAHLRTSAGTLDVERSRDVLDVRPTSGSGVALRGWQQVDAARAELGALRVDVRDLALDVDGVQGEDGALTGGLDIRLGRLQVSDGAHRLVAGAPAYARVELRDVFPDPRLPLASQGTLRASILVDGDSVSLEAARRADAIDYTLRAAAPSLKVIRPLLSPSLAEAADWDSMAVDLRSNGRLENVTGPDPRLRQDTSLEVERPAFGGASARSLSLTLHSEGTVSRHQADADLRVSGLTIDGTPASDDTLALSASWDRDRRSVQVKADAAGRVEGQAEVSVAFDRDARALVYDASGRLSGLAGLAPLVARVRGLDGFDLSRLDLAVAARGRLLGVVSGVGNDGAVRLEPSPWRTAAIEGVADVRVANVRWTRHDIALEVPAAVWHGDMRSDGEGRVLTMHADVASLRLGLGRNQIDLAGISDDTTATVSGDLLNPAIDLTERGAIRVVEQDFVAVYPATDATIAVSLRREPWGLVRISDFHVRDGAGTTLDLQGGIDLGARRSRKLSVVADVVQDLGPLSYLPARFSGRGQVKVAATVESPDLAFFRTRLDVTAKGVDARFPGVGVEAQSVDAEIPIHVDFDADDRGVRLRHDGRNAYAMLRFADQQPFLKRSGLVSIRRITLPRLEIAPFVGNLAIERNVVSLRQFEMGVRGGRVTGECALDWDGPSSKLEAHLRAAGVRSSYGEPLDGNVAIVVSARDRSIEGRAEIVRMGKRHLLDLLDAVDPLRVDRSMNRVRSALAFGYPKKLHAAFGNGFARARVEMGGLASLMSIDELRGIPTGPLVDWLVKVVFDGRVSP